MALTIPKPYIYLGAAVAGLGLLFWSRDAYAGGTRGIAGTANGPRAEPMYVGKPGNAKVEALLQEMNTYFNSQGVDLNLVTAQEVTRMRKAPGKPYAIPPREYWPRMARTLTQLFMPLRMRMGEPLRILNGYRPPDYNEAVGGAPDSRHQWFDGLDIMIPDGNSTHASRKQLALEGARLYLEEGNRLGVGFGAYDPAPPQAPGNIHLDVSGKSRTWANANYWVEQVAAVA